MSQESQDRISEVERLWAAVAVEREACVDILEDWRNPDGSPVDTYLLGEIAAAIRARGKDDNG